MTHYHPESKLEWAYNGPEDLRGIKATFPDGSVMWFHYTEEDHRRAWEHGFKAGKIEAAGE